MDANEMIERARSLLGAQAGAASIGPVIVDAHSLSGSIDTNHEWWSEVYNPTCLTVEPPGNPAAPIAFRCTSGQLTLHWRGNWQGWAFYVQIFADTNAPIPGYRWHWNSVGNQGSGVADDGGGYWYFTTGAAEEATEMQAYFTALANDGQQDPSDESEWWLAKAAWVAFEIVAPE